jgi:signal transduction histidine kinase
MWSFTHKQVVRSGDVSTAPNYFAVDSTIKSCLYVPLIASDQCLGTIAIESITANAFNENDEKLLTILANQVAITIINAQLFETANNEIEARAKIEQQLLAEQQHLEQIVAARTEELQNANSELEKSSQLKSEFMASISHELRTPLTGILGLSEVLVNQSFGPLSEKQISSIKLITDNGRRLLYMINDILDYTRLEANQMQLSIGMVSINYLMSNVAVSNNALAESKGLKILTDLPKEDVMIECDAKKIKQMLGNLISNAIKFTPDGGTIILDLKVNPLREHVVISVTDTGIGINPNDVKNLFKPFIQLDSRLERSYNGAGLGLVLVSKLAELHRGIVSVESSPGKGSCFTIILPIKQK